MKELEEIKAEMESHRENGAPVTVTERLLCIIAEALVRLANRNPNEK